MQGIMGQLEALGIRVQGSTDGEHAADQFNARDFGLIVFGGGLVGPLSERLRRAFSQQSPSVGFLDAFAPVAVRQIVSALQGTSAKQRYVTDFHVVEDGPDYLVQATILKPCTVRIEVYRPSDAPPPHIELVDQSAAAPGPFERRIDAQYRTYGYMFFMTLNDDGYCWHRM